MNLSTKLLAGMIFIILISTLTSQDCSSQNSNQVSECFCDPIETENTTVSVESVAELEDALDLAFDNDGDLTILMEPGTYTPSSNLRFISDNMSHLSIIGSTGNRDDVQIMGQGWDNPNVTHIFNVAADHFSLANVTIGQVYYHAIQVQSNPSDADDFLLQNVRIIDVKEQLLKVSAGGLLFADDGIVQCCEFEFTNGIAYQYYTGGIDAHRAKDWIVRGNVFRGIISPEDNLSEHAIHFWRESVETTVDGNQIIDCDRGIGFGLGNSSDSGHLGGLIMNNFVHCSRDVGIGLESSPHTKVYNNTVVTENYPRSIEYRFPTTSDVQIANNLVNGEISDRNSGSTGTLTTNFTTSDLSIFSDAGNYDYHLLDPIVGIIDAGTSFPELLVDFDCQARNNDAGIDIGADEFVFTAGPVALELFLFLEGSYLVNGSMHTNLIAEIPLEQPYHASPYNYLGLETLSSVPSNMVDWVLVEMRSGTPAASGPRSTSTEERKSGILLSDGSVVAPDGSPLGFNNLLADQSYHICVRHRNHLDVLSAFPVTTASSMSYDFSSGSTQASGPEQMKQTMDGKAALFAGDYNQDGVIQVTDYDLWISEPAVLEVYQSTDGNMDGVVQSTDYDVWDLNKAKVGISEIDY